MPISSAGAAWSLLLDLMGCVLHCTKGQGVIHIVEMSFTICLTKDSVTIWGPNHEYHQIRDRLCKIMKTTQEINETEELLSHYNNNNVNNDNNNVVKPAKEMLQYQPCHLHSPIPWLSLLKQVHFRDSDCMALHYDSNSWPLRNRLFQKVWHNEHSQAVENKLQ